MAPVVPTLVLAAPTGTIPECMPPNLMPFHVEHTGSSEMKRYFKTKPAKPRVAVPADSDEPAVDEAVDGVASMAVDEDRTASSQQRWTGAFRGRTIQGLSVDLPEGYGGVILRVEGAERQNKSKKAASIEKPKPAPPSTGRATRGSARASKAAKEETSDVNMSVDVDEAEDESPLGDIRRLLPTATFSSLIAWNADIPLNESNDDYLRSLTEWTALAAQIHQEED